MILIPLPMHPFLRVFTPAVFLSLAGAPARAVDTVYLFTYFTGNGEDGLHLAWSENGYDWQALNGGRSFLAPRVGRDKLMRDPCLIHGPDGIYRMVWTSGWWDHGIGYASSTDLLTWSEQKEIPVMASEPSARNCWAPEVIWDDAHDEFVIFWATTIPGRFPVTAGASEDQLNHRIYCTTTKDFETFTPARLLLDPGFSCIDATFLRAGGQLWLIVKDETRFPAPKKNLRLVEAATAEGPFGQALPPFTPPGLWVEGPTAVRIGGEYLVYFDAYTERHYGAMRSRDLNTWEDVTAKMHFPFESTPERMRHGTVLPVPRALVDHLRSAGAP